MTKEKEKLTGLDLLRAPFHASMIGKLPKPTKFQTDALKADFKNGVRCKICGGWHHPNVVHLDYVGHAALTDRLLDCDPEWNWEPTAFDERGQPCTDNTGGMWIRLTVCGVTRLGYGDAKGKNGGDAIKEIIGDALRNAAMRFGAALDLWHKGDLHVEEEEPEVKKPAPKTQDMPYTPVEVQTTIKNITAITSLDNLRTYWEGLVKNNRVMSQNQDVLTAKNTKKIVLDTSPTELPKNDEDLNGDNIPY